jgi:hypothetical protein
MRVLHDAMEEKRRALGLSWAEVTSQVNQCCTRLRPIAQSTITSIKDKRTGEGDGILQMLLWVGRTPESFVPGIADADAARFQLPDLSIGQILRWNTKALFAALTARRREEGLTWAAVASAVGGFTPGMLTNLATGPRIGFPRVMRLVRWLGQPAVTFTRIANW